MSIRDEIMDNCGMGDDKILFLDPPNICDKNILGITTKDGLPVVVYDVGGIVDTIADVDCMSWVEAQEYVDFNVIGAYLGPQTPVFVQRF